MTPQGTRNSQCAMLVALLFLQLSITKGFYVQRTDSYHGPIASASRTSHSQLHLAPQQLGSFETLEERLAKGDGRRKVVLEDLVSENSQRVEFNEAWDWQKHAMQEHVDRLTQNNEDTPFLSDEQSQKLDSEGTLARGGKDTFCMLEHEAVYTLVRGFALQFDCGPIFRIFLCTSFFSDITMLTVIILFLAQGTGSDEKFIMGTNAAVPTIRMDRGGEGMSTL